eukprot:EG_transcript_9274
MPLRRPAWFMAFLLVDGLLMTGAFYGWAPLQLMLIRDGEYFATCHTERQYPMQDCPPQLERLGLLFTTYVVAKSSATCGFGVLVDLCGAHPVMVAAGVLQVAGLLGVAFSDSDAIDLFLPSMAVLGLGNSAFCMSSFSAATFIPEKLALLVTGLNVMFDASGSLPSFMNVLNATLGVRRSTLLCAFACAVGAGWMGLLFFWRFEEPTTSAETSPQPGDPGEAEGAVDVNPPPPTEAYKVPLAASLLQAEPFWAQVTSLPYVGIFIFTFVSAAHSSTYLGITRDWLEYLGDHSQLYSTAFGFSLAASIPIIPIVPYALRRLGYSVMLHLVNVMGMVVAALSAIQSLPMQVPAFLLFVVYRAFLYSTVTAFVAETFGAKSIGRLTGLIWTAFGLCFPAQYLVVWSAQRFLGGSYLAFHVTAMWAHLLLLPLLEVNRLCGPRQKLDLLLDVQPLLGSDGSAGAGEDEAFQPSGEPSDAVDQRVAISLSSACPSGALEPSLNTALL